jgi:elongation factor Ts
MEINAKDVMNLRNKTGLPMMDCKAALAEAQGDTEKAEEILRKKLKGKMEARSSRSAGEGRLGIKVDGAKAAASLVEVKAETDFTAKSEKFIAAVNKLAELVLDAPAGAVTATPAMSAVVEDVRISTGENVSIGRLHKFQGTPGATRFGSYLHHDGKVGSVVVAEGSVGDEILADICKHIVAAVPAPKGVSANDIPAAIVEKERKFRIEQAMESGKPKEIAEKMVEGGMRKFFEEIALLEQPFIKDPAKKIKDLVGGAKVTTFSRWQIGEEV